MPALSRNTCTTSPSRSSPAQREEWAAGTLQCIRARHIYSPGAPAPCCTAAAAAAATAVAAAAVAAAAAAGTLVLLLLLLLLLPLLLPNLAAGRPYPAGVGWCRAAWIQ